MYIACTSFAPDNTSKYITNQYNSFHKHPMISAIIADITQINMLLANYQRFWNKSYLAQLSPANKRTGIHYMMSVIFPDIKRHIFNIRYQFSTLRVSCTNLQSNIINISEISRTLTTIKLFFGLLFPVSHITNTVLANDFILYASTNMTCTDNPDHKNINIGNSRMVINNDNTNESITIVIDKLVNDRSNDHVCIPYDLFVHLSNVYNMYTSYITSFLAYWSNERLNKFFDRIIDLRSTNNDIIEIMKNEYS